MLSVASIFPIQDLPHPLNLTHPGTCFDQYLLYDCDVRTYARIYVYLYVCMYVCLYVCLYVCMYVCMG